MSREPPDLNGTASHVLRADRGDDGVRLDLVLLRHVGGTLTLSRRRLQQAIEKGDVAVNGIAVTRTSARVVAGDRIDATLPAPIRRLAPQPQDLPLDALFEDDHLVAVNKAPGIVAHPSYKHPDGTLVNALLWHFRGTAVRPRLLSRLDKDTSGVILVSKTGPAHAGVVQAMRAGAVRKEYLAIVRGVPRPAGGEIALALARDPSDVRRVAVSESRGKESVTRYETISTGPLSPAASNTRGPDAATARLSLVRCELITGRMHQIRAHLAARGWPILGDRVYGAAGKAGGAGGTGRAGFPRQALHAWRLSLAHPVTGDRLVIVAPIPDDMRELIEAAGLQARS